MFRSTILCCGGTGCHSNNSGEIIKEFKAQIAQKGLDKDVEVVETGCHGLCAVGPIVIVYPEGAFYSNFCQEAAVQTFRYMLPEKPQHTKRL